jgi:hypothetical protein
MVSSSEAPSANMRTLAVLRRGMLFCAARFRCGSDRHNVVVEGMRPRDRSRLQGLK